MSNSVQIRFSFFCYFATILHLVSFISLTAMNWFENGFYLSRIKNTQIVSAQKEIVYIHIIYILFIECVMIWKSCVCFSFFFVANIILLQIYFVRNLEIRIKTVPLEWATYFKFNRINHFVGFFAAAKRHRNAFCIFCVGFDFPLSVVLRARSVNMCDDSTSIILIC